MNRLLKQKLPVIIFGVIMIIIFTSIMLYTKNKQEQVKISGNYTIGFTIKKVGAPGGTNIKYSYTVKKIKYYDFGKYRYILQTKIPNGRYFVAFFPNEPDFSEIYFKVPVPDTIIKAPEDGWTPKEFKEKFGEELWQKIQND